MNKALKWIKEKLFPGSEEEEEGLFPPDPELDKLPDTYARRFSLAAVQEPAQVLGRDGEEGELKKFEKAWANWKRHHSPLLVTAEPGAGMTSFLHAALHLLPDTAYMLEDTERCASEDELLQMLARALGVEQPSSLEELAKTKLESPRIVVFENLERLFLRRIGGYDVLRQFLVFMNATKKQAFWIVTINNYSAYFLDRAVDFSDNFQSRITLRPLARETIREMVLQRNEGYEMVFLKPAQPSGQLKLKRRLKNLEWEERQKVLENHFFESLLSFAEGNPSRAMVFWLYSAIGVKEKKVYLKEPHFNTPKGESLRELMVLDAIFQHTSLSLGEVDDIFRHSAANGHLILDELLARGWLFPRKLRDGVQEYQVNFLYMHELKAILRKELNRKIS